MKTLSIRGIVLISLFFVCSPALFSQGNPRLIVRSNDMGAFHSVNMACIEVYKNGIQTVVEVMPVTAWFPEAVRLLNENPGIDVGIHLAITSEWENIKWRPLTRCPSLTDENGYFYPMMSPHNGRKPVEGTAETHYLIFDPKEGRASAKANCNTMSFSYKIKNELLIEFGQGISTLMACPDDLEQQLTQVFAEADNLSTDGTTLSLNKARMAPLARFTLAE